MGVVRGAIFTLVALLIAFSFFGAATRHVDRLDLIVKEANALGTVYLRADVLPPPMRGELKSVLRDYTEGRIALLVGHDPAETADRLAKVGGFHECMWTIALGGTEGNPQLMRIVLPPLNDVIDLHTKYLSRRAATSRGRSW